MSRQTRFSDERGQVHCATVYYDFDLDGDPDAEGGVILLPGVIPAGAIIINGIVHILTSLAGVGASVALHAVDLAFSAGLFSVVTAEPVANWDAGLKVTDILTAVAGEGDYAPQILAVDAQISITVNVPLTAGRMAIHLTYIMSPTEVPELASDEFPEIEA